MKLGSLFDGSGGFPLAGAMCGIEPVWASEIEPYPIAVTKNRLPNMRHLGDISKINGANIEPVDIITFGSPCQDLSVAGKRAGLKHEDNGDDETTRSGLFMEAVRIITEMRGATNGEYPKIAVWENVPGAFSSNKGEDFRTVLEELIKIVEPNAVMPDVPKKGWAYADCYRGDGWSLAYRVLDAQYIRTAQRRRRIYLVFCLTNERAGEILFKRQGLRRYPPQSRTQGQGTATDVEGSIGTDDREGKCLSFHLTQDPITSEKCTPCISSGNPISGQASVGVVVGYDGYNGVITGDKIVTLGTNCDRATGRQGVITLEPGIASREGGHIYEGVSGTLRANAGDNQMSVAYGVDIYNQILTGDKTKTLNSAATDADHIPCTVYSVENHPNDSRVNIDDEGKVQALTGRMGTGGGNVPMVMEAIPIHDKATRYKGGGPTRNDDGSANGLGVGVGENGDPSYTITTGDKHSVCVAIDRALFNQGKNALYDPQTYEDGTNPTIVAKGPSAVCYKNPPHYIVRRPTPIECARLQGFPDEWGHIEPKSNLTDEEYKFWLETRNTHAEINGKQVKDYTKKQMLTWYNKLWTDSAEYKMWGNGIALPCALYVMEGIKEIYDSKN